MYYIVPSCILCGEWEKSPFLNYKKFLCLADKYRQGKETFQIKCAECHIAPERHVTDQYMFENPFDILPKPSKDYFIRFIMNGNVLRSSGDRYAKKLADIQVLPGGHMITIEQPQLFTLNYSQCHSKKTISY